MLRRFLFVITICILFSIKLSAATITGIVLSTDGKTLPFASIFVKGTSNGTTANSEGQFTLTIKAGQYTIICQHVGYGRQEKNVIVGENDIVLTFTLSIQEFTIGEVILQNGEDPAYEIIRQTIKKRKEHLDALSQFQCQVYTKGQLRVRNYPKKIFGQKVDFEDGDTSKNKILFLSETIANYYVDKPAKEKVIVLSSKVSGQSDGLGLAAPQFLSFYENIIKVGDNLNPRGFISPIAATALNYYRYKYVGTFYEDGKQISRIKVTPKRVYEPLFTGYISIVEDDWVLHSVDLLLLKQSQLQQLDTLHIVQQHRLIANDTWFVSSQVIYPAIKILGFDAYGSFVNIYSAIKLNPGFTKKVFDKTILKYLDSSTKKTANFWSINRPIPLQTDEIRDYKRKDSLEKRRKDPDYLDSLSKRANQVNLSKVFVFGQRFENRYKRTAIAFTPLLGSINFNPAEGLVISNSANWTKKLDSNTYSRKMIFLNPVVRYGFANKHLNGYLTGGYSWGKSTTSALKLSFGKRVFQFNSNSPIGEFGNTISSLFSVDNRIKSYEAVYFRGSYRVGIGEGLRLTTAFQYQDRSALDNRTDYSWKRGTTKVYTPNYPNEIAVDNIQSHKIFYTFLELKWQPGTRYIELPERKINIGSKNPAFSMQLINGINKVLGSSADFAKWHFAVTDEMNLKLKGMFRYRLGMGGFLSRKHVELPDYNHFNGNISELATEYLNSFQLLPIYQFSNTSTFYTLGHFEYNLKGFLTNKIPGIRKLNIYLVTGANGFYINGDKNYYEWFIGIDNIFKQLRIDFVQSYQKGKYWQNGIRIGLPKFKTQHTDDWL